MALGGVLGGLLGYLGQSANKGDPSRRGLLDFINDPTGEDALRRDYMRMQMEQMQQGVAQKRGQQMTAQENFGGYDPSSGITWNTGRPGSTGESLLSSLPASQQNAARGLLQMDPDKGIGLLAERAIPKPMDPKDRYMNVDGRLVDIGAGAPKEVLPRAPKLLTPEEMQQELALKRAGAPATNVNLPGDNKFYGKLNEDAAAGAMKSADLARSAASSLDGISTARSLLDKGMITGTGADFRLGLARALATAGLTDGEDVANTDAFFSTMGRQTLDLVKQLGAGSGISNADRDYADKVAGGRISINEQGLRRILDINERASRRVIDNHGKTVASIMADPSVPQYVKDQLLVTAPAKAGGDWSIKKVQ